MLGKTNAMGGGSSGIYAWRKYNYAHKPISFESVAINPQTVLQLTSSDYDLSTKTAAFFVGYKTAIKSGSVLYNITIISETQAQLEWGSLIASVAFTYEPTTARMTLNIDWGSAVSGEFKQNIEQSDYVETVVSDNLEAYSTGEDGNYWYERVLLGGIDVGEITPTGQAATITVSHNLGRIPSEVMIFPQRLSAINLNKWNTILKINGRVVTNASSGALRIETSEIADTLTEDSITFRSYNSSYGFPATTLYWVAKA